MSKFRVGDRVVVDYDLGISSDATPNYKTGTITDIRSRSVHTLRVEYDFNSSVEWWNSINVIPEEVFLSPLYEELK